MTDGTQIGLILELKNGKKIWVFEKEIQGFKQDQSLKLSFSSINSSDSNPTSYSKNFSYVFNPLNLINWLINSLKDVF